MADVHLKDRSSDARADGPGPLLRRAPSRAQHRRHEDDGRFLRRRAGHAAGPRHEGAAGARHRAGQPRQSAVRGGPPLFLRHGPRRPAGLLRNAEGRQSSAATATRSAPCSTSRSRCRRRARSASASGSRPPRCPTTGRWKSCRASSRSTCSIRTTSGWNSPASRATARASPRSCRWSPRPRTRRWPS